MQPRSRGLHVDLNHLGAGPIASVGYVDLDNDGLGERGTRSHRTSRRPPEKRGIRQAVAERDCGLNQFGVEPSVPYKQPLAIANHRVLAGVVQISPRVLVPGRDRGRHPPSRIDVAKQNVGESVTQLLTPKSNAEDCGGQIQPTHLVRTTGIEHYDRVGVGRAHAFNELDLVARKPKEFAVSPLGLPVVVGADHQHHCVTFTRHNLGLGEQIPFLLGRDPHANTSNMAHVARRELHDYLHCHASL